MDPSRLTRFLARRFGAAVLVAAFTLGLGAYALAQRAGGPTLTPSTPSPILDGMTPVFWLAGSDPTVAPGLDLPIGSIARTSPSSAGPFYFTKVGFAPTEWSIVQGHSAVAASWPIAIAGTAQTRYYCVDGTAGSDSRRGYVDAAAGATLTTCSSVAVKTVARALTLIPRFGAGRSVVLLIKTGTYAEFLDLTGFAGYRYFLKRGSTDLTNSVSDRITAGARTAVTGPNGNGSFTVAAAGASTSGFSINAGSLGATDADVGWRFRFDAATATVALRNVSCFINAHTSTAITCGTNIAAAPSTGTLDTGFVERPGVLVATYREMDGPAAQPLSPAGTFATANAAGAVGIAVTGTTTASMVLGVVGAQAEYAFLETTGAANGAVIVGASAVAGANVGLTYFDEAGTSRSLGSGLRASTGISLSVHQLTFGSVALVNASASPVTFIEYTTSFGGGGSYFAKGPTVFTRSTSNATTNLVGVTSTATVRATRFVLGPLTISGWLAVMNVDVSNSASSGIVFGTSNSIADRYVFDTVTGTSNTTFGIDFSNLVDANVRVVSSTITGTSGDLKLGGAAPATLADLILTNVVDSAGNNIQGAGGSIVGQARLVTNQSGGALAVGSIVRSNGTSSQVTCAQADTTAHAGNSPCVMVTAPASTALGYMVCDGAPYVLYDGAPTLNAPSFESTGTACKATTTTPALAATNRKLRIGAPYVTSGNAAYTAWHPETVSVAADGNP